MWKTRIISGLVLAGTTLVAAAAGPERQPAADGAHVYFLSPVDGAVVGPEFTVRFGLAGMGVAPAGVEREKTGHHHLLIDLDTLPSLDQPLPATEQIKHFGGGQTETRLSLPPGEHTLQLVLGDHFHIPHNPPLLSEKIRITVSTEAPAPTPAASKAPAPQPSVQPSPEASPEPSPEPTKSGFFKELF